MKIKAVIYGIFAMFFTILAWCAPVGSPSRQSLGVLMSISLMIFIAEFVAAHAPKRD